MDSLFYSCEKIHLKPVELRVILLQVRLDGPHFVVFFAIE